MEEIIKKLKEHDHKFEKVFETLDEHTKTLEEHTSQIDLIARTVVDHTERLDRMEKNMATKDDIGKILNVLDGIAGLVKKHDEEIVTINYNHKRLDHRVELLEQKI